MEVIAINPHVFRWARKRVGMSIHDVGSAVGKPSELVEAWEKGEAEPSYTALEKLAYKQFKIPLAVLFFPEPPYDIPEPISKFRWMPEAQLQRLSPDTRRMMLLAASFQDSLRELEPSFLQSIVPAQPSYTASSLLASAPRIREAIGISLDNQFAFRETRTALNAWRQGVEKCGVYTFKGTFKDKSISGFCLIEHPYPVIMINNSTSFTRQIFTLMHELAHILLGVNGITGISDHELEQLSDPWRDAEIACNRFAAALLVPEQALFSELGSNVPTDMKAIAVLSQRFKVSREVILRRFLDAGMVSEAFYLKYSAKWKTDYLRSKEEQNNGKKNKGNYYPTKLAYLGEGYTRLAFRRYQDRKIDLSELAGHLRIKVQNLKTLKSFLE